MTLSLALIAKNEEALIERVLNCAKVVCDELIVVDTGSTDRTIELAKNMGAKVSHFDWINDFSAARNAAFSQATSDWIMWLDADDVIPPPSQAAIIELKSAGIPKGIDVVEARYNMYYDALGNCVQSHVRERLIRRSANLKWVQPIHELVEHAPDRTLVRSDIIIEHREDPAKRPGKRTTYLEMLRQEVQAPNPFPLSSFYYANELFNIRAFADAIKYYQLFLSKESNSSYTYDALVQLSICLREIGNRDEALAFAEQAVQLAPLRAEAVMCIGQYYFDRGEWQEAMNYFEQARNLSMPDIPYVQSRDYTWRPLDFISLCYFELGDYHKAAEFAVSALSFREDVERIKTNLKTIIERL